MGAKNESRTEVKKKIESEISTTVQNITENITNVCNETTNEAVTNMVQEMKAKINVSVGGINVIRSRNISAIGSDVDIQQDANVQAENEAIIKIMADASAMAKLADKVANDVNNKLENNSAAKQSMEQVAAIAQAQKDAGGPEALVSSIMGSVDKMVGALGTIGGGTTDTNISETTIRNNIKTEIFNKTINKSDIKNVVKNRIENSMKQAAEAQCNMDTTGNNTLDVDNIVAMALDGQRGSVKIKQTVSIKAFNKCFIDLKMGQGIVNDIGVDKVFTAKSDTTNKTTTDAASKQEAASTSLKVQESAVSKSIDNLVSTTGSVWNNAISTLGNTFQTSPTFAIMVIGGGITAAIAAYYMSQSKGKDGDAPPSDDESGTQVGGFLRYALNVDSESSLVGMQDTELFGGAGFGANNYGNVYLWAFLAVLVYYVYGKSLHMSSVLVVVIIGYIIYTIKNKDGFKF
jgi:hypothetical protein